MKKRLCSFTVNLLVLSFLFICFNATQICADDSNNGQSSGEIPVETVQSSTTISSPQGIWNMYWQEAFVIYTNNNHPVFRTHIWCNNPTCFIQGVEGTVSLYDMDTGEVFEKHIYNHVPVPTNQYNIDFDFGFSRPSGHRLKMSFSYFTDVVTGTMANGGYRSGNIYKIVP